jgi:hypothetical protein
MANQMCIISGNATFAQMMLADPSQVARAVEAISKAGEQMSFILGQCADLRRRVSAGLPHGEGLAAAQGLESFFLGIPGWEVEVQPGLEGDLCVPTQWVVFAAEQAFAELEGGGGQVRVQRVRAEDDTAFLPGGSYFEVRLTWQSAAVFSMGDVRKRYENLGLLAAFELIRQSGGKLEGFTSAEGRQGLLLCVPYVFDLRPKSEES